MEIVEQLSVQRMDTTTTTTVYVSEAIVVLTLTFFTLTYICVFYLLQRREHHVRTGSLKEKKTQPFTSPHPGRKVSCNTVDFTNILTFSQGTNCKITDKYIVKAQVKPSVLAKDTVLINKINISG